MFRTLTTTLNAYCKKFCIISFINFDYIFINNWPYVDSFFLLYDAWVSTKQNYWYYPSSFGLNNYTWTATANSSDFKTSLSQESGYIYIPTACKLKSFGLNGVYPSADVPIEIGVKSGSLIADGTYFLGNLYSGTQTFKTNKYNTVRVNPDLLLPKDSVLAVGVRRISSSGTPIFLKAIMFFELEVING